MPDPEPRERDRFDSKGDGATASGMVAGLYVSTGGVPKLPITTAMIRPDGVEGDAHTDVEHHGRPWQAVCLWSLEVVEALQAEGHPISAGCAGENVSITGLDWHSIVPGTRLRVGHALIEITKYTTPCSKNAQWFVHGRFDRMGHDSHPGSSRVYASVISAGRVSVGDQVVVEPDHA
jgi:MOSC domain-containing protein YiiM